MGGRGVEKGASCQLCHRSSTSPTIMPSTTRSMRSSASSGSSNEIGHSPGKKRSLFAPSPPSKRTQQQQQQAADEDEQEEESKVIVDGVSQPASAATKLSRPSKQATLYSVKLGAAGRLQRAERKGVAAAGAGAGEGGGKRRKIVDAEAEAGPSGGSADASGSRSSAGKMKAEDVDDQPSPSRRNRSRTRSPTPRLPSDFKQVTSPSFLSTCYTPFPGCHYLSSFLPSPTTTSSEASSTTLSRWYSSLSSLPNWYNPTLKVYGREIVQSRPIAAFSKVQGLQLRYSGQDAKMDPWPEVLREMEDMVRDTVGREVRFNHAFLNWYADGKVNIGRHSDNREWRLAVPRTSREVLVVYANTPLPLTNPARQSKIA